MTQRKKIVFSFISLLIFSFYLSVAAATESQASSRYHIGQYHVGDVSITSTGSSMFIVTGNKKIDVEHLFKLEKLIQPSWDDVREDVDPNHVWDEQTVTVLSIIGNYASLFVQNSMSGGAIVSKWGQIYVIDLSNPNKKISLTHFFSKKEILSAFVNSDDPTLKNAGLAVVEANSNLSDLNVSGLADDYLSTFAFSDFNDGFVTVIFSSGNGYNYDESYFIKLKVPKKLEKMLLNAKKLKKGFLVKNRDQVNNLPVAYKVLKLPPISSIPSGRSLDKMQ